MPVATKATPKQNEATFLNGDGAEIPLAVVEGTRRRVFRVTWLCGDEFHFAKQDIEEVLNFFAIKKLPSSAAMVLKRLPMHWDNEKERYVSSMTERSSFSAIMHTVENGKPMLYIDSYGLSIDLKSFTTAWKTLNK